VCDYILPARQAKKIMQCIFCKTGETEVIETRIAESGVAVRRRRRCLSCDKRFTSFERAEMIPVLVVKRDGRREKFDRDKLRSAMIKAVGKTWLTANEVENILNEVEVEIGTETDNGEVDSKKVGDMVADKLKSKDKLAYIRFSSVFRNYQSIDDFEEELKSLSKM
jgi:transcriptional repressor NrdR